MKMYCGHALKKTFLYCMRILGGKMANRGCVEAEQKHCKKIKISLTHWGP